MDRTFLVMADECMETGVGVDSVNDSDGRNNASRVGELEDIQTKSQQQVSAKHIAMRLHVNAEECIATTSDKRCPQIRK